MSPTLRENVKRIVREVLVEMETKSENPVVKILTAREKFVDFVEKTENKGDAFTKEEFEILETLDTTPYKASSNEVRYSATESTNNKNKELVVVKKQKRYVAFFSMSNPADMSTTQEIPADDDVDKDDIIIKVSRPFKESNQDISLLSNFINVLTKEYQI
jgi:hypothetical protein